MREGRYGKINKSSSWMPRATAVEGKDYGAVVVWHFDAETRRHAQIRALQVSLCTRSGCLRESPY
jgi:hypothetical protein